MNGASRPDKTPLEKAEEARKRLLSVSNETEVTGQFDVSKEGVTAKGIPPWAMGVAVLLLAAGVVVLVVLKFAR